MDAEKSPLPPQVPEAQKPVGEAQKPVGEAQKPVEEPADMKKKSDDPKKTIEVFLKIVEDLHQKVSSKSQEAGERITETKSATTAELQIAARDAEATPTPSAQKADLKKTNSAQVRDQKLENKEDLQTSKLQRNLRLLKEDVVKLQELRLEVAEEVWKHIRPLEGLLNKVEKEKGKSSKVPLTKGMKKDLEVINKKIFNLMCQVPLLPNKRKRGKGDDSEDGEPENNGKGIVCLPGIYADVQDLKGRAVFKYVQRQFLELSEEKKIYLLSFAVFPENQEVNKTMLMYWWIGEGILSCKVEPSGNGTDAIKPENVVKEILEDFTKRNLIEPVENKHKVEPNSYKMTPFVHSSLVLISKEIGLFDMYHKGEKPTMKKSALYKVCLVEDSSSQQEAKAKKMPAAGIETIFNVSERFPDFTFKWFPEEHPSRHKMLGPLSKTTYKMLKVFYLGRWERTAKRHIEVENPELMKNLQHMVKLKLLSFQGISRIERLDDAVCKLQELIILDLRACYNLEKLPDKIDSLKALIYLDITDCYMIDRMPKRLSWLDNLEVLKGFVVSDAIDEETVCTLVELKHLTKLRKLSITINKEDFGVEDLIAAIQEFKSLEKLKVAWGGINKTIDSGGKKLEKKDKGADEEKKQDEGKKQDNKDEVLDAEDAKKPRGFLERSMTWYAREKKKKSVLPSLPQTLKKLDLQCYPDADLPKWLCPSRLLHLEKLYIKGGTELTGFGELPPEKPTKCTVKVLRLKFLPKLKVEWRDLSNKYFPEMNFLEKYQCPQVGLCPTDGIGIWRKPE